MRSIILTAIFILAAGAAAMAQDPCPECPKCDECDSTEFPFTDTTLHVGRFFPDTITVNISYRECNGFIELRINSATTDADSVGFGPSEADMMIVIMRNLLLTNPMNFPLGHWRIIRKSCWKYNVTGNFLIPCSVNNCCVSEVMAENTPECPGILTITPIAEKSLPFCLSGEGGGATILEDEDCNHICDPHRGGMNVYLAPDW